MLGLFAPRRAFVTCLLAVPLLAAACTSDEGDGSATTNPDASAGTAGSMASGGSGGNGGSGASGGVDCNCGIELYRAACGVDGMTYDAACGNECVPVEIECEGECPCPAAPGEYMGTCAGDGGLECSGDLVCVQWFSFNGGSGMAGRYCTQPCSLGLPRAIARLRQQRPLRTARGLRRSPERRVPSAREGALSCAPSTIRTYDLRFRRPTLYPAELWARPRPGAAGSD
jgi:hypothetical protein